MLAGTEKQLHLTGYTSPYFSLPLLGEIFTRFLFELGRLEDFSLSLGKSLDTRCSHEKKLHVLFYCFYLPLYQFPLRYRNKSQICIFQKVKIYAHQDDQPLKHGFPVSKLYDLLSLLD